MNFANPTLLWLCLAAPVFWWVRRYKRYSFGHPHLAIHRPARSMPWFAYGARLSQCVLWLCLVALLSGPVTVKRVQEPKPGALILIQQDASDSQQFGVTNKHELELAGKEQAAEVDERKGGKGTAGLYLMDRQRSRDGKQPTRRIDVSLAAIRLFLQHTHGNPVGLMVFDSGAYTSYPPTTNYKTLVDSLPDIEQYMLIDVDGGHGTNFDGPSGTKLDAGALQSVCDAFKYAEPGVVKIHIMSTDGGAEISAQRFKELTSCYERLKIQLIVFGVGEEWYEHAWTEIRPLKEFVQSVGGIAVPVGDRQAFNAAVEKIDALARSSIYMTTRSEYEHNYMPWLVAACLFFAAWLGFSITIREQL